MIQKMRAVAAALVVVSLGGPAPRAQELTLTGEIVEVSCFAKGVDKSTGAAHVACAKDCVSKGQALGILTDGDGLIKITGDYAANRYARLIDYIGKQVELRGTSDRFLDYSRAINVTRVVLAKTPPAR